MNRKKLIIAVAVLSLSACSKDAPEVDDYDPARDYFTFANTEQFVTDHLALDLDVDFENREFRGYATLAMRRLDVTAVEVVLDSRDLDIVSATVLTGDRPAPAQDVVKVGVVVVVVVHALTRRSTRDRVFR